MAGALVLVGLSGSGKSTVARLLATHLRMPLLDTDRLIEAQAGVAVAELFAIHGEEWFRALEASCVAAACVSRAIVATGGGAVLREENRRRMRAGNLVVWLDPPLQMLAQRLTLHQRTEARPLLGNDPLRRLRELSGQRRALYAAAAHLRIGSSPTGAIGSHRVAVRLRAIYRQWLQKEGLA